MLNDRITADHVQRAAIVYVRQSSPEQVRNHAESTRIQVGLCDKAMAYGWPDPVTILDDLGVSASGFAHRVGFQRLAAEVSLGHVGIILCFEASRLSRNSKDWAQLFEICGHLNTLVADLDQVYDLAVPNDRLILGVKGSVSEYELSLFRQRSQEAIVAKAKRGALTCKVGAVASLIRLVSAALIFYVLTIAGVFRLRASRQKGAYGSGVGVGSVKLDADGSFGGAVVHRAELSSSRFRPKPY